MQIKIISVPVVGGEDMNDMLNAFLRSHKVIKVEKQLVQNEGTACWSFCVSYLNDQADTARVREKKDYQALLDSAAFERFNRYRNLRKQLAQQEGVPPYVIFTDDELAEMAKETELTAASIQAIKGIGSKKVEKYGAVFLDQQGHEKSE